MAGTGEVLEHVLKKIGCKQKLVISSGKNKRIKLTNVLNIINFDSRVVASNRKQIRTQRVEIATQNWNIEFDFSSNVTGRW
jgi:hypothetical protein